MTPARLLPLLLLIALLAPCVVAAENVSVTVITNTNVVIHNGGIPYDNVKFDAVEQSMNASFRKAYCDVRFLNPIYYVQGFFGVNDSCQEYAWVGGA